MKGRFGRVLYFIGAFSWFLYLANVAYKAGVCQSVRELVVNFTFCAPMMLILLLKGVLTNE
jgi:hypothetical protein